MPVGFTAIYGDQEIKRAVGVKRGGADQQSGLVVLRNSLVETK